MSATQKQREEFRRSLRDEYPGTGTRWIDHQADLLMRHGVTHCRLQEMTCSVEMTEREEKRHERKKELLEKRITAICAEFPQLARVTRTDTNGATHVRYVAPSQAEPAGENECYVWLQRHQPHSADHATTHEGWSIGRAGVVPDFQGDPRGATVKLTVPSGRTTDWGQVGVCAPTS